MPNRKGLDNIRTLRGQVDRFRARTPQGALIELARLAQKKVWLRGEMKRWQERIGQIQSKLEEINRMEKWLYRFVDESKASFCTSSEEEKSSPATPSGFHEMNIQY